MRRRRTGIKSVERQARHAGCRAARVDHRCASDLVGGLAVRSRSRPMPAASSFDEMESQLAIRAFPNGNWTAAVLARKSCSPEQQHCLSRRRACRVITQTVAKAHRAAKETRAELQEILQKKFCGARCAATNCSVWEICQCLVRQNPSSCRPSAPAPSLASPPGSPAPPSPPPRRRQPVGGTPSL